MNDQSIIERLEELEDDIARLQQHIPEDHVYNLHMAKNNIHSILRISKVQQNPETFNSKYDFIFEQQCCFCKRNIYFSGNDLRRNLKIKEDESIRTNHE